MRSPLPSLLLPLLASVLALTQSQEEAPVTRRPDLCTETEVQEARTLLRDAVARMGNTLPERIPVDGVAYSGYTLYNGTLGPLLLTDVNITAQQAVCRSDVRHFPFVIGVGTDATMKGIYHYHCAGNNVTTPEARGRVTVTFSGVSFNGKLTQQLTGPNSVGGGSPTQSPVWSISVSLEGYPSFSGIATSPQNSQVSGVPYFDMMQAADRSFVPVFAKLPETHVLPALKEALGAE
ncbi:hypothetical protein HPB50_009581 [Hyalomma asiaticum]|uniref:Uncharacterized protein n=1 Tax=Hyalomma asiaticum TaxID=266040 RepID=A0ACB7RR76_HYAAI|nr:hypothetical protein HPB50_009581 [Hyalomma asiaticum]